jgi:diguanylate cyclase (GGDEF)-like protein
VLDPVAARNRRRTEFGRALQRRAVEVGDAVAADWSCRRTPCAIPDAEVSAIVHRTTSLGTEAIGRYIATGAGLSKEESRELAASSRLSATNGFPLRDLAKNHLVWRDATLALVAQEAAAHELPGEALAEAQRIVRASCDAGLIHGVEQFDTQRRTMARRLDEEHEKLAHLALHDPLTGLANRSLLLDRLEHALAPAARHRQQAAVLYLDVDGFKNVNDTFGHKAGDRLLIHIARTLTGLVRPSDTVARFGGDEFVVVYEHLHAGQSELDDLVERVRTGLSASFDPDDELAVTISIGAALVSADSDPESALARADAAMYAAKAEAHVP